MKTEGLISRFPRISPPYDQGHCTEYHNTLLADRFPSQLSFVLAYDLESLKQQNQPNARVPSGRYRVKRHRVAVCLSRILSLLDVCVRCTGGWPSGSINLTLVTGQNTMIVEQVDNEDLLASGYFLE